MAADNLSQSRKRRIAPSDEVQAKKTKENGNSSSGSIDLENEVRVDNSYDSFKVNYDYLYC